MHRALMDAMVLDAPGRPLRAVRVPVPRPQAHDVLIKVAACAVCRTDLHIADGELAPRLRPLIPGHEIAGTVAGGGALAHRFRRGQRVGAGWLGGSCGICRHCLAGRENLCEHAVFTGYHRHGGFAEYAVVDERYCFALPACYGDRAAAPLMCAGLIGYRAYRMAGAARSLGLYGFGAAAHLVTQLARAQGRTVYAFTRPSDTAGQAFALQLGAHWAGPSDGPAPDSLAAAIIFAPDGALVPRALAAVERGGVVVCAGIHMSDIPSFPYELLWGERALRSVANLTRADGEAFLAAVSHGELQPATTEYPLSEANEALRQLRAGSIAGAAVLIPPAG